MTTESNRMPSVSIIVPVFKVEPYLEQCIDSILAQDYPNLEIILVDDGSPDNCPAICDRYAAQHPNIKVIHKINQGAGMARNSGLDVAEGEYITFLDSDDWLQPCFLKKVVEKAVEHDADMVLYDYNRQCQGGNAVSSPKFETPKIFSTKSEIEGLAASMVHPYTSFGSIQLNMAVWDTLFNRRVISHRFESERKVASEDLPFKTRACLNSNVIVYVPVIGPTYRFNASSLSHTYSLEKFYRFMYLTGIMREIFRNSTIPAWADMTMIYAMSCAMQTLNFGKMKFNDRKEFLKKIASKKIWSEYQINPMELSTKERFIHTCLKKGIWQLPLLATVLYYNSGLYGLIKEIKK